MRSTAKAGIRTVPPRRAVRLMNSASVSISSSDAGCSESPYVDSTSTVSAAGGVNGPGTSGWPPRPRSPLTSSVVVTALVGRRCGFGDGEVHARGPEDVAGGRELCGDSRCHLDGRVERDGLKRGSVAAASSDVYSGSAGWCLREAALVGEACLFLLDVGGVGQEDRAQLARLAGCEDRAAIAATDQSGEPAGVVDVGVGDDDGVDGGRIDRERLPVRQSVAFGALEQPCVDEHPHLIGLHEEAAAR